jgi:hypothetical protein
LSESVPVFGPWTGALDQDGETLKLLRPGTPEPDGTVPFYRVDHVSYRTNAPWPQPPPAASLERRPLAAYGNDPASWQVGPTKGTPGVAAANRPPVVVLHGNPVVPQQAPLTLTLEVADLDVPWQSLSLTSVQLPPGSTFDPASGALSWTPTVSQGPGDFVARFVAADSSVCGSNQTTLDFTIRVTQPLEVTAQFIGGGLEISFPALAGEIYRIEFCTDLTLADWSLLEEITVPQHRIVTLSDPAFGVGPARFYRVRWLR